MIPENWQIKPLIMKNERNGIVEACEDHEAQFFGTYVREDGFWLWQMDLPTRYAAEQFIGERVNGNG